MIVRREPELAASRDPRAPFDFGDDRVVPLPAEVAHRASDKARSEDALDDEPRARREAPACALDRDPRGDAGARRRPIYLALGEDADVARVRVPCHRGPGEDRPVEEGEIGLAWMAYVARALDRTLDRAARRDQIAETLGRERESDGRGVDERVERSAERQVVPDLAHARDIDLVVERHDEGRDVLERDAAHSRPVEPRTRDRKSTRLNSSHVRISYAVFCLKKKHSRCYTTCTIP